MLQSYPLGIPLLDALENDIVLWIPITNTGRKYFHGCTRYLSYTSIYFNAYRRNNIFILLENGVYRFTLVKIFLNRILQFVQY